MSAAKRPKPDAGETPTPTDVEEQNAATPEAPVDELTAVQEELAAQKDKTLRLAAELQNQQKRAARERSEALRFAEGDFARDLLVIIDDLERTLQSGREATDVESVVEGVRIVYDHFMKVLKQKGIEPIAAEGEPFDPSYHEAMLQQPSDEVPAGHVLQELSRGYVMHDRVLRSSRVIVSSGGGGAGAGAAPPEVDETA